MTFHLSSTSRTANIATTVTLLITTPLTLIIILISRVLSQTVDDLI
jgi:hypothetical protein